MGVGGRVAYNIKLNLMTYYGFAHKGLNLSVSESPSAPVWYGSYPEVSEHPME